MKKTLLPLCLIAASAMCANAQGTVWAEDNFDWLESFSTENSLGDPVGTDNAETKGLRFEGGVDGTGDVTSFSGAMWNKQGYRVRMYPQSAIYEIFAHKNYLCIGGDSHGYGIQWGGIRWYGSPDVKCPIEKAPDMAYLSFDWCPYKDAEGKYDNTEIVLSTRPADFWNNALITHDLKDGEPMRWIHVEIDLYDTKGGVDPLLSESSNFMIEANGTDEEQQKCQKRRFYIDNLKLHSEPMSGIGNVTVEDESAPIEYYNLQGVRLEQPAKGLVIRKQGKRSTTVYFK